MVVAGGWCFILTALALEVIQNICFYDAETMINLGKVSTHTAALYRQRIGCKVGTYRKVTDAYYIYIYRKITDAYIYIYIYIYI